MYPSRYVAGSPVRRRSPSYRHRSGSIPPLNMDDFDEHELQERRRFAMSHQRSSPPVYSPDRFRSPFSPGRFSMGGMPDDGDREPEHQELTPERPRRSMERYPADMRGMEASPGAFQRWGDEEDEGHFLELSPRSQQHIRDRFIRRSRSLDSVSNLNMRPGGIGSPVYLRESHGGRMSMSPAARHIFPGVDNEDDNFNRLSSPDRPIREGRGAIPPDEQGYFPQAGMSPPPVWDVVPEKYNRMIDQSAGDLRDFSPQREEYDRVSAGQRGVWRGGSPEMEGVRIRDRSPRAFENRRSPQARDAYRLAGRFPADSQGRELFRSRRTESVHSRERMPSPDAVPHIRERYRRTPGFPRSPSVESFRERSREGRVDDVLFMASRDELPTGRQERRQTPPRHRLYPPLEGDDGRNMSMDPRSGDRRSSSADKRNIRKREAGNVYSRLGPRLIVLSDYWKHNPKYDKIPT
jgi:hypothetical protein